MPFSHPAFPPSLRRAWTAPRRRALLPCAPATSRAPPPPPRLLPPAAAPALPHLLPSASRRAPYPASPVFSHGESRGSTTLTTTRRPPEMAPSRKRPRATCAPPHTGRYAVRGPWSLSAPAPCGSHSAGAQASHNAPLFPPRSTQRSARTLWRLLQTCQRGSKI